MHLCTSTRLVRKKVLKTETQEIMPFLSSSKLGQNHAVVMQQKECIAHLIIRKVLTKKNLVKNSEDVNDGRKNTSKF